MSIATPKTQSLIDTVGTGYRALNRRPWVIGVPIAVSGYLWFGPPLVLGGALDLTEPIASLEGISAEQRDLLTTVLTGDLRLAFAWLNFIPVFSPTPEAAPAAAAALNSIGGLALAVLLINLVALLLSSLFLTWVSGAVRNDQFNLLSEGRAALQVAGRLLLALLALIGVGVVLGLPFLALSAILVAVLPIAAVPVLLLWYVGIFWAYVYAGFAPEAILLSRSGPLRAIYNSVNLVRRNLGATLGLLLISIVISSGLAIVWRQLAGNPVGLMIALVGSAYIGSGLSAARMEFYRERMALWKRAV